MSTIKVNKIENTSTTAGGVEIDSSGHVQVDGLQMPTAGALSNRNLIINGACRVNQRSATQTITTGTIGPVDHFETRASRDEWEGETSQETVSVNNEFVSCHRVKTTTPETTVDGFNQIVVESLIEGQDLQHLFQSTSAAKSLTLSFWVRSSQTGTYVVKLYRMDGGNGRQLNKTYTINSADTWQKVTLTWVGDTSGNPISNDVNEGMRVCWQVAAGSGFTSGSQPTTWTEYSNEIWAAGHTENSVMTTDNATWDVTGVQLEVGEKATPFEHRSYGDELARCQRYYEEVYMFSDAGTTYIRETVPFKVTKRAAPTGYVYAQTPAGTGSNTVNKAYQSTGERTASVGNTSISSAVMALNPGFSSNTDIYGRVTIDAEL